MIDLALVKSHLRVDGVDEDALIQAYTDAAISAFEAWTNRKLVTVLPETVENHLLITKAIEQGALLLIGHWYANRESVVVGVSVAEMPMATKSLWMPHRWACV
jgi:N-acetylglucosamine-6-phosphate deacetylase